MAMKRRKKIITKKRRLSAAIPLEIVTEHLKEKILTKFYKKHPDLKFRDTFVRANGNIKMPKRPHKKLDFTVKRKKREFLEVYNPKEKLYRDVFVRCVRREGAHEYSKFVSAWVCYNRSRGRFREKEITPYLYRCKYCPCGWQEQADKIVKPWERMVARSNKKKKKARAEKKRKKIVPVKKRKRL